MNSGDRVRKYLEWKGISHTDFQDETKLSNGYIGKVKDIGSNKLNHIINHYPDLSLTWVVTGEGNMTQPVKIFAKEPDMQNIISDPRISYISLNNANDPDIAAKGQELISEGYVKIPDMPRCDGALAIRGDNMYPLLKSADIAIFKRIGTPEDISWGEMYVVHIVQGDHEQLSVHYIHKGDQEGTVKLLSYNSRKYPAKEYPVSSLRWIALVKATVYINSLV